MAAQTICPRCAGRGGWEGWPGFTCHRCGGKGKIVQTRAPRQPRTILHGKTQIGWNGNTLVYHTDCGWHQLGDANCRCGNYVAGEASQGD